MATKLRNGVLGIFTLTAKGLIVKDAVSGRFMKAPSIVSTSICCSKSI